MSEKDEKYLAFKKSEERKFLKKEISLVEFLKRIGMYYRELNEKEK